MVSDCGPSGVADASDSLTAPWGEGKETTLGRGEDSLIPLPSRQFNVRAVDGVRAFGNFEIIRHVM
jgi:hypothetical protein